LKGNSGGSVLEVALEKLSRSLKRRISVFDLSV
jgi:hypothetical protein